MADPLVAAAVANWGPRFVLRGVDFNDFLATTGRIESWAGWLDAWVDTGNRHCRLGEEAEVRGHPLTAGEAFVRAAVCYHFAKFLWLEDEARYRATTRLSSLTLQRALRLLDPTWERVEVPYQGSVLPANLRRPPGGRRSPLVLLIPGLDSTKEEFFHWENAYLKRGLATLSLDGPGQGEGGYDLPIEPAYEKPVSALLDHLAGRADLDLDRVGVAGVSLGGYYAPRALAFEPRLRAGIALSGTYNLGRRLDLLPPMQIRKVAYHFHARDEQEARQKALGLDLEGVAEKIEQPLLVVSGEDDRLMEASGSRRLAAEARRSELWMIPGGNHGVTNQPYLHVAQAADWIREKLG